MTATVTRWWWVRHAPVTMNDGRCYGQTDVPCDTGDTEAFARLAVLLPKDAIWVSSNLQRTRQTAEAILRARLTEAPGPNVIVEPALAEQHFGQWQGMKYSDLPVSEHPFWLAPAHTAAPGGESFADLTERARRAIHRLTTEFAGRDIISVSHGGTIRAALGEALGLTAEFSLAFTIDNLSLTRLDHFRDQSGPLSWRVVMVNVSSRRVIRKESR